VRSLRKFTVAAVSIAIAGSIIGLAAPASATPAGFPPVTPIVPGPSVPPLPPGVAPRIPSHFPSCATIVFARTITATQAVYPSFGPIATPPGAMGAADPVLQDIITSRRSITCSFAADKSRVYVTETVITAADYKVLTGWYAANASSSVPGGGPTRPGDSSDTFYAVGDLITSPIAEYATVSPDGWWITVQQQGIAVTPYLEFDAVERFLEVNPWRT
jgi:hypothetical protein